MLEAGEQLHASLGHPSGLLRIIAARISIAMALQPLLASFPMAHPRVQSEVASEEG